MTSPASYFVCRYPSDKTTIGAEVFRVHISPRSVKIYTKEIIRSAGHFKEKAIREQTFSLHRNRNGVPYLKVFRKEESLGLPASDVSLLFYNEDYSTYPQKVEDLTNEAVLGWFYKEGIIDPVAWGNASGKQSMYETIYTYRTMLLFPVLRDKPFLRRPNEVSFGIGFVPFNRLQNISSNTVEALRQNSTWPEFLHEICPTVKTQKDEERLLHHADLLPLAAMNIDVPISELGDSYHLRALVHNMEGHDQLFHFLFANLNNSEDRIRATECLTRLLPKTGYRYPMNAFLAHILQNTPDSLKEEAAKLILKQVETWSKGEVVRNLSPIVTPALSLWFWSRVTEPYLETDVTQEQVEKRYEELFNRTLQQDFTLLMIDVSSFAHPKADSQLVNHFRLMPDCFNIYNQGHTKSVGYLKEDGTFLNTAILSLDSLLQLIETAASSVDAELSKGVGQQATADNRVIYLMMQSKHRNFKYAWNLYVMGVTDPARITALNKAKIRSKRDIRSFNELPDDMFYELLALR